MKFGKLYIQWIKYLKEKRLYGKYMYDYSMVNEYLRIRNHSILTGDYFSPDFSIKKLIDFNLVILNGKDWIMSEKDEDMSYFQLKCGINSLTYFSNMLSKTTGTNWIAVLDEFGYRYEYIEKPKILHSDDILWSSCSYPETASTEQRGVVNSVRGRRVEYSNIGQWYDIYYNRGRNNNRNNIRWRR
jgi:hypothetical protein